MRVLFSGLQGLTGSYLAYILLSTNTNLTIASIVRSPTAIPSSLSPNLLPSHIFYGDISDINFLTETLDSYRPDLFVHLSQISLAPTIVRSCVNLNFFPRLIILGTTGVFSSLSSCSKPYLLAENFLNLFYPEDLLLVLRSNLIYGTYRDKNFHKIFDRVKNNFKIPLPSGTPTFYKPIFYQDLAAILYSALSRTDIFGFYNVCGPDILTLDDVIQFFCDELSMTPHIVRFPLAPFTQFVSLIEKLPFSAGLSPISSEQLRRLRESKVYADHTNLFIDPSSLTSFFKGVKSYTSNVYI